MLRMSSLRNFFSFSNPLIPVLAFPAITLLIWAAATPAKESVLPADPEISCISGYKFYTHRHEAPKQIIGANGGGIPCDLPK
ncbi:hypothetical protein FDI24_gp002 [Acidovorax phage ACP17]|uniref:Uncharacterized protein n=1 Tax=Acidovorax phage ACP17 TaxID=2010329 RepID=A0A223AIX5_9CAUD|nr:hypothetical protein FDI24_gp002 [Acidovorax phage ACP17]ASS33915.1 hypothetical protein [Acidovorax phage ACP17]